MILIIAVAAFHFLTSEKRRKTLTRKLILSSANITPSVEYIDLAIGYVYLAPNYAKSGIHL